ILGSNSQADFLEEETLHNLDYIVSVKGESLPTKYNKELAEKEKNPLPISDFLVSNLNACQFPQWSELKISLLEPGDLDHRNVRLGDDLSIRLRSHARYKAQAVREQKCDLSGRDAQKCHRLWLDNCRRPILWQLNGN
ncbi:MAG: hypothetical protein P1V97_22040, partial [Planctomycetota bacterium]|nr:hypothetical protein [Planctomycetota bacterium]